MSAFVVRRFSIGIVLSSLTVAGWLTWSLHKTHSQLAAERMALHADITSSPESALNSNGLPIETELSKLQRKLAVIEANIAAEEARQQAAEQRAAELQTQLPRDDEVTSSLGRVEDLGRTSSALIRGALPQFLHGAAKTTTDSNELDLKTFFQFLSAVPELQAMEDDPVELRHFHGALLRDLFGLDDRAAQRVIAAVGSEFDNLRRQGLTISRRPTENPTPWETRRDTAIRGMAMRIAGLLPPGQNGERLLEAALNITGGPRGNVNRTSDRSDLKLFFPGIGERQSARMEVHEER